MQIRIALFLIEEQKKIRNNNSLLGCNSQSLHVIDFGCGTLAMKFAVAWEVAVALEKGEQISSIKMDALDANPAMVRLGTSLWEQFKIEIKDNLSLGQLFNAVNMLESQNTISDNSDMPATEIWLSAIHAVYSNNTQQVKAQLANLHRISSPDIGFLSGRYHTRQSSLFQKVSPFANPQYKFSSRKITSKSHTQLPNITAWRRRLNTQISPKHNFLSNPVTSRFSDALGWIYTKAN